MIAAALAALALLPAAERPPGVGIGLLEWQVAVYRPSVPPGPVRLNITNLGEDAHDLAVRRRRSGEVVARVPPLRPGSVRRLRVTLARGRYLLVCTVADHEALGMRAPLTVARR